MKSENIVVKTSQEWYALKRELEPYFVIMDPDGWDRKNYQYSFNEELITEKEFNKRVNWSTCLNKPNKTNKI